MPIGLNARRFAMAIIAVIAAIGAVFMDQRKLKDIP
jgi:hypothetical protein